MNEKVKAIISKYNGDKGQLVSILQDIQTEYHYLPKEALIKVSETMAIPVSRVYDVATFFIAFSLEPRGKHLINVCLGTACHVRGGEMLIEHIGRLLNIKAGETTQDMQFTLEAVNCLGCCALGPVMVLDGKYFGSMAASKVEKVLDKYMKLEVNVHD